MGSVESRIGNVKSYRENVRSEPSDYENRVSLDWAAPLSTLYGLSVWWRDQGCLVSKESALLMKNARGFGRPPLPNSMERIVVGLAVALTMPFVTAQTQCGQPPPPPYDAREDCANADPLRQPFFGDLHVHTSNSLDADMQGTRLGPDSAYDFARGSMVEIQPYDENGNGLRTLTIDRPLDFAMVADHAEFFGEISLCRAEVDPPHGSLCWLYQEFPDAAFFMFNIGLSADPPSAAHNPEVCGPGGTLCIDESVTLWNEIQDAAENAYDRTSACTFTSFAGYEWTGSPGAQNLHRNVVFKSRTVPTRATSYFEAPYAESLWDALEADCTGPDCEFLTIPHNSNMSSGLYFKLTDRDGNPYSEEVAARRGLHEPLVEVMQHKGQSECIPASSPADELCDFEVLPFSTLAGPGIASGGPPKPGDFVREALKEGMSLDRTLGANPFKYGMIGSTDTHIATPGAVAENNYPGHGGAGSPAREEIPPGLVDRPYYNPGGLAVVWSEENSRDSLFEAMRRREVYATSGSRPTVRFFGSRAWPAWSSSMCGSPTMVEDAYSDGVPMGGDLGPNQHPFDWLHRPQFLVSVLKDPQGADLQRVQIIKATVDATTGAINETVFDVAGDPNNGASVDPNTCGTTGAGFSELCTVWVDDAFSPLDRAFYYVRVIENPTCRWQRYQCNAGGVDCAVPATVTEGFEACCDGTVPDTIQERAWTSPIWFAPEATPPAATATSPGDVLVLQRNSTGGGDEIVRVDAEGGNPTSMASFGDLGAFFLFDMEIAGPNTAIVSASDPQSQGGQTQSTLIDIYEVDLLGGTATVIGSLTGEGSVFPYIAVEPNGDVLVSSIENGSATIKRIDRPSGTVSTAWTDAGSVFSWMISTDSEGHVAAVRQVNGINDEIIRIDLATGQSTVMHTGANGLFAGTRADVNGDIYSNTGGFSSSEDDLVRIDPHTLTTTVLSDTPQLSVRPFAIQRNGIFRTHLMYTTGTAVERRNLDTGTSEQFFDAPDKHEHDVAVVYPACSDGLDNDGDGQVDFPADAMCANELDNHE